MKPLEPAAIGKDAMEAELWDAIAPGAAARDASGDFVLPASRALLPRKKTAED